MTNSKALIFAAAVAAVFGMAAVPAYNTVSQKATEQAASLGQLARWKSEYDSLRPFQTQWEKSLTLASQIDNVDDLRRIIDFERYGLKVDTEQLAIEAPEALTSPDGTPLDADRVCLTARGQRGITATADAIYPTLIDGIDRLGKRFDVEIPTVTITATAAGAKAVFPLCLRLRH